MKSSPSASESVPSLPARVRIRLAEQRSCCALTALQPRGCTAEDQRGLGVPWCRPFCLLVFSAQRSPMNRCRSWSAVNPGGSAVDSCSGRLGSGSCPRLHLCWAVQDLTRWFDDGMGWYQLKPETGGRRGSRAGKHGIFYQESATRPPKWDESCAGRCRGAERVPCNQGNGGVSAFAMADLCQRPKTRELNDQPIRCRSEAH